MSSENRFGYEWGKYSELEEKYEDQFKNWVHPLTPDDFNGKKVLDAGCGMGRNSYWALKWGAGKLVGFDYDERSVNAAKKNLGSFSEACILFKSVYDLDWQNEFDLAFSIGVIHHLKNPGLAIKKIFDSLKPGGRLLLWLYSYEGNEWIPKYVDPVRKNITSKLPLALVHLLSYFFSIPLWLYLKAYRGRNKYFLQLKGFKYWHIHSIVFDQLIPDVANYWKREEVIKLFEGLPCKQININRPPNECGWNVLVQK